MEYLTLDGHRVPRLGFGTWQLEGSECTRAVRDALDLGYRHLDTAQMYGNEDAVGRGIAESGVPRDELFVTTKVWWDRLDHERFIESTEASLSRLGLEAVDLLLIHWPNPNVPLEETLSAMERLQRDGKVRHLGVSNFPPDLLDEAASQAPIRCDQVEYHPFLDQGELLDVTRRQGMMLTAYSPLAQGKVAEDATLSEIADEHGRTPAQVALRWLLQQDGVAAIPKAASREHRRANLEVFDFRLSDEEMQRIFDLSGGRRLVDPEFAPRWES